MMNRAGFATALGVLAVSLLPGWAAPTYELVKMLLAPDAARRREAREALAGSPNRAFLPALNDVLYYHFVTRNRAAILEINALMEELSGEEVGSNKRRGWAEWVGRRGDIQPAAGYLEFKRDVFSQYDSAFARLLDPRFPFRIRPEEIEWGGVRKDGIPALDRPRHLPAARAGYLGDEDRVFGVYVNGEARAYPHRILDWHEMCNDVVGGVPITLSYCTLCGSGILFDGRLEDKTFTFGSSGLLYRSNKLMYDRTTESLWSNLTGEPVVGPLAESGLRLDMLPLVVSTWKAWRERHPETGVLDVEGTGFERDYRVGPYEAYFESEDTMFPVWLRDDRLRPKERVFALIVNGQPKAYPVDRFQRTALIHDRVAGVDLVLVGERGSEAVRAYRSAGQRFALGTSPQELLEQPSGTVWQVAEDALVCPSTGERLDRVPGHNAFWFGWYAFYPTTEIFD